MKPSTLSAKGISEREEAKPMFLRWLDDDGFIACYENVADSDDTGRHCALPFDPGLWDMLMRAKRFTERYAKLPHGLRTYVFGEED